MPDKRTAAEQTDAVWLRVNSRSWSRVPAAVRESLLLGMERIAAIRLAIAKSAKVRSMPPIEIVPEVWSDGQGLISGRTQMLALRKAMFVGVQLPATTAACLDRTAVRRVLVHEFSHCFYYQMRAVEDQVTGVTSSDIAEGFDVFNADDDARLMVPANEWFGRADAKAVALHHDPRLQRFEKYMVALAPVLPVLVPPDDGGDKSFTIRGDIWNHAQALIRRRMLADGGHVEP
jgi:hypothetical protein